MKPSLFFYFSIIFSSLFTTNLSYGDSLDIRELDRSDPFTSSTGESQWQIGLRENVGLVTNHVILEEPSTSIVSNNLVGCPSCMDEIVNSDLEDNKKPDGESGDENKKDKYGALNKASNNSGDGQAFSGNAQGLNGSTVKVINGVPYVVHKEDLEAAKNDMKVSKPSTLLRQASQLSAVEMNRLADSGGQKSSGRRSRSGAAVDGSGASGGFGDYESSSGRKGGSASLSSAESALKGFSKGFHGTDGMSDSGSRSLKFKNGKFKLTKGKKRKPASNNMAKAKDILNRQLQLRMNANRLEFGSANSFLFESMCQHYNNYALKHGIPTNKAPCPKN